MPVLLPERFLRPEQPLLICTARTRLVAQRLTQLPPQGGRLCLRSARQMSGRLALLPTFAQPPISIIAAREKDCHNRDGRFANDVPKRRFSPSSTDGQKPDAVFKFIDCASLPDQN